MAEPWHRHAHRRLRHSVKARLVALFLLLALAMTGAFLFGTQRALTVGWRDAARPLVADYVDRLAAEIGSPPDRERARSLAQRLPVRIRISGPQLQWQSGDFEDADESGYWSRRDRRNPEPELLTRVTPDGHRIEFGVDTRPWRDRPRFVGWLTLGVLLALTAVAYAFVRRLLRPLDDISQGARRFGAGEFRHPIPVRRHDELGQLAGDINAMAGSLHQMLEAKRGLLLAISHELRSPITRARLNTELLEESGATGERRQALMADLQEMAGLVTDLLESERLGGGHAALHLEEVDLQLLLRDVLHSLRLARPQAGEVQVQLAAGVQGARVDPARMRLLLRNLVDNALRHTPPGAPLPLVTLVQRDESLEIAVRDWGAGVEEAALSRLAEPFYRPDASRERATGGVGLGLHLCKLVAQAHGGTIAFAHAHPGLDVTVTLPVRRS